MPFLFFLVMLFSGCSHVFYQPQKGVFFDPKKLGLAPQQMVIEVSAEIRLAAWFFAAEAPVKGTVLQFHGNGQNMTSHYILVAWLAQQGYNVLVFDYRGYGESTGKANQEGLYQDGLKALEVAFLQHQKLAPQGKFIVIGQSLGGAVALRALEDFAQKDQVNLLVLDSTFTSYQKVARKVLAGHWLTWLISPLAHVLVSDKYSAENAARTISVPILVIHAKHDPVVPFSFGEELAKTVKNPQGFWILPGYGHTDAFYSAQSPYRNQFLQLLLRL